MRRIYLTRYLFDRHHKSLYGGWIDVADPTPTPPPPPPPPTSSIVLQPRICFSVYKSGQKSQEWHCRRLKLVKVIVMIKKVDFRQMESVQV